MIERTRRDGFEYRRPPVERPTEQPGRDGHTIREHPAFGCVEVVRSMGGRTTMFRSGLPAATCITLRVHKAVEDRGLQSSRHYAREVVTELAFTELQWAEFVSAIGAGGGVPCTLVYSRTGDLVRLPEIDDRSAAQDRSRHIEEMTAKQLAHLREAIGIVDRLAAPGTKVTKADLAELRSKLLTGVEHAPANFRFAADMVTEHLAEVVQEAKAELRGAHAALGLPAAARPALIASDDGED